ncbi:MAG TPA: hypothetical protein VKX96_02095 [Chloroflexota bacterium]|nr:hypothetical protein [Chloroflexota bacterium]
MVEAQANAFDAPVHELDLAGNRPDVVDQADDPEGIQTRRLLAEPALGPDPDVWASSISKRAIFWAHSLCLRKCGEAQAVLVGLEIGPISARPSS